MKKTIFSMLAILTVLSLSGAEVIRSRQGASPKYPSRGDKVILQFKNRRNAYSVSLTNMPADQKQDPGTDIGMPGPHHFFNFPNAGFLNLTVNGIQSRYLLPKEITTDDSTGTAKADVLFNFDGTRITLHFEMNDKSPMLFLTLIHDPASDPVRSMEVNILAYPSINQGNAKKNEYQREVVTASKTYKVDKGVKWLGLARDCGVMDLIDRAQQPPKNPKSQGPCAVLADWNGIASGKVHIGKIYNVQLRFTLKPEAGKWRFAFFEQKKKMSNDEYFAFRKKNEAVFAFPE